jgi:hypothetical protein
MLEFIIRPIIHYYYKNSNILKQIQAQEAKIIERSPIEIRASGVPLIERGTHSRAERRRISPRMTNERREPRAKKNERKRASAAFRDSFTVIMRATGTMPS